MLLSGINQSTVKVTLRNPLDHADMLSYYIIPDDHQLSRDWIIALKEILQSKKLLEKNFCFLGFPKSQRTLEYLCEQLNQHIETINKFNFSMHGIDNYVIEEWFHPNTVRFPDTYPIDGVGYPAILASDRPETLGLKVKHQMMNQLHNHFERLQGTVNSLSSYYKVADDETKYAIRQLNNICHEIESLVLSQRKFKVSPEWTRPSQITTFLNVKRYNLTDEHRQGFVTNGYDRKFAHVYMHWTQIGKTLFEVWRDEHAPTLDKTTCEAVSHLQYYSGEFDIEWAKSVTMEDNYPWHVEAQTKFQKWLLANNLDPLDSSLSLGYLQLGKIDLEMSFGTDNMFKIWDMISDKLDIYEIEIDGISNKFEYNWNDPTYKQMQIDVMKPGYDHSSRG
jgi:hypothetical protein